MNGVVIAETLRRHLTAPWYIASTVGIAFVAFAVAVMAPSSRTWHGFIGFVILAIGAGLIGPELSAGTLQLILARPIHRSVYLLSRWVGVVLAIWIVIGSGLAGQLTGLLFAAPHEAWPPMIAGAAALAIEAMLVSALLAFFGACTRAYFNVAIYLGVQILLAMWVTTLQDIQPDMPGIIGRSAAFLRSHPSIARFFTVVTDNLFPDRPASLAAGWIVLIVCNAAIVLLLACIRFRNREVPYGAD